MTELRIILHETLWLLKSRIYARGKDNENREVYLGGFTDFKLNKKINAENGKEYVVKLNTNTSTNPTYYIGLSDELNNEEKITTINNNMHYHLIRLLTNSVLAVPPPKTGTYKLPFITFSFIAST